MPDILDYFRGGGGGGGGPRPLVPGVLGGAGAAGVGSGAASGVGTGLNNPWIAAALGAGGALMSSGEQGGTFGQGLRSALGAGTGSYFGTKSQNKERRADEKREREMEELLDRFKRAANRRNVIPAAARRAPMAVGGARGGGGALPPGFVSGALPPRQLQGYGGLY